MPRSQISIKLEPETLDRVDEAASQLGVTRTAYIERAIEGMLERQEALVEQMSREDVVEAAVLDLLMSKSEVLVKVAKALAPELRTERVTRNIHEHPKLREAANKRKDQRKRKTPGG